MHNSTTLIKRIPEIVHVQETIQVPVVRKGGEIKMEIRKRMRIKMRYVQGIYGPIDHNGNRHLEAIVEGSRQDARDMLAAGRTESGNTFKGFKKIKVPKS